MVFTKRSRPSAALFWLKYLTVASLILVSTHVRASPADSLYAKFAALKGRLDNNAFQRPLTLDSTETANRLKGDVYALIDHPFKTVKCGAASVG